jgi:hypothetical protein
MIWSVTPMSAHLKTRSSNMRSDKQTTGRTSQCQPDALQKMRRFAGADFHFPGFLRAQASSDESDLDNRDQALKFPLAAWRPPQRKRGGSIFVHFRSYMRCNPARPVVFWVAKGNGRNGTASVPLNWP